MTNKKVHHQKVKPQTITGSKDASTPKKPSWLSTLWLRKMHQVPYQISFILLFFFTYFTYSDVFVRAVQASYVCSEPGTMDFLTQQDFGALYLISRYALLIFHSPVWGSLIFSIVLTLIAVLLDRAFRVPLWLRGVFTVVPFGLLFYFAQQGIGLYYKSEPSLFMLQTLGTFLIALVLALVLPRLLKRKHNSEAGETKGWHMIPFGLLATFLSYGAVEGYSHTVDCENTRLTARMQNQIANNNLTLLTVEGLRAKQPSRSVAAYYALGLLHNEQILEHLFDISFHFPKVTLPKNDGTGEYGIFTSDCNFYSGLINAGYRAAMDHIVMDGPSLYSLKRMALCAILKGNKALANKYLTIIGKVPFEKDFVEEYRPYVDNPDLIRQNYTFNQLLKLSPMEHHFEQNYRSPVFLGYYTGILQGSNEALPPSMAACLYSKDLPNLAERALQLKQMNYPMPLSVMEALSIFGRKNPEIFNYFPELADTQRQITHPATANVNSFFLAIQQYFQEKYKGADDWRSRMSKELTNGISDELRAHLSPNWLGHYVYYYYCENVVMKNEKQKSKESSVN